MKIVMDAHGGDKAPLEVVKGAIIAVKKHSDIEIILTGNEEQIKKIIANEKYDGSRLTIVNCTEVIDNNESPTEAIKTKKDSSLVRAFDLLKEDNEIIGLISAGSTGAILTGAFLKIGRIAGVSRPALIPIFPTLNEGKVILADCGANVDCKPVHLLHFALMANVYAREVLGIENPRVGLLNIGAEKQKGNELTKAVFEQMKSLPINFVGNAEARDLLSGKYDVIISDGFDGNILLKGTEGAFSFTFKQIIKEIKSSFISKIGGLLLKKTFKRIKEKFDYNNMGGSPFLGVKKLVIKTHGTGDAKCFAVCVDQVIKMNQADFLSKVGEVISKAVIAE